MDIVERSKNWLRGVRRHPRWIIGAVAGLAVSLILLRGCAGPETPAAAYYEVKRGNFLVTIVEGGALEAVNEVVIRNEVEGSARIIFIVPEGSYVKKGDLLVQLDTADAAEKVNQQEISFEKAKSAYVQAEKNLEIEKSASQSAVDAARLNVEFAGIDLEKFNKGQLLQELRNAEIEITTATGDLLLAKDNLEWSEKLFARGFETKNAVDQGRNTVQDLTLKLEKAQTNLWVITSFDHPKMLRTYEAAVEEATNELQRAIAQGEAKLAQLNADLMTQRNSLELTREKLESDKEQLAKSKIYAPQDGLVVYGVNQSRFSQQSMIEEGAMIRERQEIIKLPDTSSMKVGIKVHESHVSKVRPGLTAFVVLDSMPDKRFQGRVSKVGVLPDTQSMFGNPNLKVYKTEIVISDPLPDVKPSVSARAEIVITNIPDAITVPLQAVTSRKGQPVVFRKKGDTSEPVPVVVGLFNTKFIEITSGLNAGDQVLLSPPYNAEEKDLGGAIIGKEDKVPEATAPPENTTREPEPGFRGPPGQETSRESSPAMETADDSDRQSRGVDSGERPRGRNGERGQGEGRFGGGPPGFNREEFMKRFDKNGDGELDETERAAIRESFGGRGRGSRQPGERPPGNRPPESQ